ncbi:MAG: hypothetical protein NVSMB1_08520 [Polyangiales bacterium]
MPFRVYVAAPYTDAPHVRAVHERLRALRMSPTSSWADHAQGEEDFSKMSAKALRAIAKRNDDALSRAHAVIALPRAGVGREMFAEVRIALSLNIPVVWVGETLCLSAFRDGVKRVATLDDALEIVQRWAARAAA